MIQMTLFWRVWSQAAFRFWGPIGIFLLLSYLAWLRCRQTLWTALPLPVFILFVWA